MIFTTDALLGATIGLSFALTTTPVLLHTASRAIEANRNLTAGTVAQLCNSARTLDTDEDLSGVPVSQGVKVSGTCGTSGGDVSLVFNKKVTKTVSLNDDGWYELAPGGKKDRD